MGKHTLKIEFDYNFVLVGISSHEKDYRISWALNNALGIDLTINESLEIKFKNKTDVFFSIFSFKNEEDFLEFHVISNFSEKKVVNSNANNLFSKSENFSESNTNGTLIPEMKQINYFLLIKGEVKKKDIKTIVDKIKKINLVLAATPIDIMALKSKKNLIF